MDLQLKVYTCISIHVCSPVVLTNIVGGYVPVVYHNHQEQLVRVRERVNILTNREVGNEGGGGEEGVQSQILKNN